MLKLVAKETIQNLFFHCHVAHFVWRVVQVAFGLRPPKNTKEFFGPWQGQVDSKLRSQVCVGASAIVWSIWLSRKDVIFYKKRIYSYLQVIFRATYMLLVHPSEGERQANSKVGMSYVRDSINGDFCQAWVAVF